MDTRTKKEEKEDNQKNTINNIMRWILFGVFLVVAPPILHVWFRIIVGLKTDFIEYIPDILLAVLAVCCNLINTCVDGGKKIAHLLRWILSIILGCISLVCWGFFFIIRFMPRNSIEEYVYNDILKHSFYCATFIIISCTFIGIVIELYTATNINKSECKNES